MWQTHLKNLLLLLCIRFAFEFLPSLIFGVREEIPHVSGAYFLDWFKDLEDGNISSYVPPKNIPTDPNLDNTFSDLSDRIWQYLMIAVEYVQYFVGPILVVFETYVIVYCFYRFHAVLVDFLESGNFTCFFRFANVADLLDEPTPGPNSNQITSFNSNCESVPEVCGLFPFVLHSIVNCINSYCCRSNNQAFDRNLGCCCWKICQNVPERLVNVANKPQIPTTKCCCQELVSGTTVCFPKNPATNGKLLTYQPRSKIPLCESRSDKWLAPNVQQYKSSEMLKILADLQVSENEGITEHSEEQNCSVASASHSEPSSRTCWTTSSSPSFSNPVREASSDTTTSNLSIINQTDEQGKCLAMLEYENHQKKESKNGKVLQGQNKTILMLQQQLQTLLDQCCDDKVNEDSDVEIKAMDGTCSKI